MATKPSICVKIAQISSAYQRMEDALFGDRELQATTEGNKVTRTTP